jgi:uncharacterized protein
MKGMKTIYLKVHTCKELESLCGNMFRKKIIPLYFETRWGIHTFFVKEPIDVLILDEENRVQVIKKGLKPWRLFFWNPKYRRVLELPHGRISQLKIENNKFIVSI